MKLRRLLTFTFVFILLGSVAFAQGKRRTEFFTFTFGPLESVLTACPAGFNVVNRFSMHLRVLVRVDKEGMPVQEIDHAAFSDVIYYNDADPSYFLEGSGEKAQTVRVVFADNMLYVSGQNFRLIVPGEGAVFQSIGRLTLNLVTGEVEWHGPHDWFTGNFDALCLALTP